MKKKTIIIIASVFAGIICMLLMFGIIAILISSTPKTIKVGDYTLKLGKYKAVNAKDENEPLLVLYDNYFVFEGYEDDKYEFTIGEKELLYLNKPFFLVNANDELELEAGGGVKYVYNGKIKKSSKVDNNNIAENNDNKSENTTKENGVKIKQSEVSALKLVNYNGGEFSMKIPEGWKVSKGGSGIQYGLRVYDPNDDRNQIFYIIKMEPFYKSQNAINMYKLSLGSSFEGVVMSEPSTENFYKTFNDYADLQTELNSSGKSMNFKGYEFPRFNNFNVIETSEGNSTLHNQAVDDKVLRATFNNGSSLNDGESEGLFTACIVEFGAGILGYGNEQFSYYMAYNVSGITAAKDELVNYQEILLQCLNSIQFSTGFTQSTVKGINQRTESALNISNQVSQSYKSYNDAWSNRQKTYDIMSQKRSDATLGYERVYDTETGEIYKAYNGFTDDYKGNRYKAITDSQYTEKITGYIEK